MIIPANLRTHYWRAPHGPASFEPNGKIIIDGEAAEKNREGWTSSKPMRAARIFVGLNVGGTPRWELGNVLKIVRRVREEQTSRPGASLIAQMGIYTSRKTGAIVDEESVQVVILNDDFAKARVFDAQMLALAEALARELEQEEVIVEIQVGGVSRRTFGVVP